MYNYSLLPEHMRGAMQRYIEHGIEPGSFLAAVLSNDLKEAVGRADVINRARLFDIVLFVVNEIPADAQGSRDHYQAWIIAGGLAGIVGRVKEMNARNPEGHNQP